MSWCEDERPLCDCGRPAALKKVTDRSKESYGRWFWGCKNFNDNKKPCRFFEWYDGEEPEKGKVSGDLQKADGGYRCMVCNDNVVLGDEHVCRLYGTYQCSCGKRWTSGYTWTGEAQRCNRCNTYQYPESCQELQRREGRRHGSGRPHDTENCGMCKSLGYPCCLAAHPGEPGFARHQLHGQDHRYRPY